LENISLTEIGYVSMAEMLHDRGASIGDLATAIETAGVWTWDRYGRFKRFDAKEPESLKALDRLAFEHGRLTDPQYEWHPQDDDPVDDLLYLCGWRADALPELHAPEVIVRNDPRPQATARHENATLRLLEAMRRLLRGELTGNPHPDCKDDESLVGILADFSPGREGLGRTTIKDKFKKAGSLWEIP
jgi:hypothetical protein